jgi:alkanesulfonate monooxygenase SsuD/methylene tetrahydromethanopterin reductase-like flavin-dependent oxidoreductase (luciferase family)
MKFSLFFFPSLGAGDPSSYDRRLLGKDPEQFAYLLEDVKLNCQLAEELGFYGVYFAEHHFCIEGFETSHNPLLMDCWVGMHTQRLKLGQLGLVLPSWNPLRLAEDISTLSHFFGDRLELGFARGFQTREVAPLAAAHQVEGALSDHSEADLRNRRLFLENYNILMAALTRDLFHYDGEFSTVPPKDLYWRNIGTEKYGGGVDSDGLLTDIGIVPSLARKTMPQRWQAFAFSEETIRWAAREGMNMATTVLAPDQQRWAQEIFQDEAQQGGRPLAYGDGVAYLRGLVISEDSEEARYHDRLYTDRMYGDWLGGGKDGSVAALLNSKKPSEGRQVGDGYSYEKYHSSGHSLTGDPDEVTRGIEALHAATNCEYLIFIIKTGGIPRDVLLRSLELFGEKVMPRLDAEQALTSS